MSLWAMVQPSHSPVHKGVPTNITITFLTLGQKTANILQPHVDYDVTILKDGKQVFQVKRPLVRPFIEGVFDKGENLDSPGEFLALG